MHLYIFDSLPCASENKRALVKVANPSPCREGRKLAGRTDGRKDGWAVAAPPFSVDFDGGALPLPLSLSPFDGALSDGER